MIPRLAYLTDAERGTGGRPLDDVLRALARGGLELVILREFSWSASRLTELVDSLAAERRAGLKLVVSRRTDLACALGLDGVHLTRDSTPVAQARRWLGPAAWIGYSAHSGAEARRAAKEGASYVVISPIYPTASKPAHPGQGPEWLASEVRGLSVPALALGGVTPGRVAEVVQAGAHGVAAVSALGAVEDPTAAARRFMKELDAS